jgi:hypothetical protein
MMAAGTKATAKAIQGSFASLRMTTFKWVWCVVGVVMRIAMGLALEDGELEVERGG